MENDSSNSSKVSNNQGESEVVFSICHLPGEVLQTIFCYLDVKSLVICKRVCKNWKEHVNHLKKKRNFWYDSCQKEIPSWIQFDLLDNIFPSHFKDQSQVDWEEIFKCWFIWNSLFEPPMTILKLVDRLKGISSIKVSGEWLMLSTCEGRGKLYAQSLTESSCPMELYAGSGAILNIEMVISDKLPYSNVFSNCPVLEQIFNSLQHNEVWLELKNSYVQLGEKYCHSLDKIQQKVRHTYGYEVRLVSDTYHSSIILKKKCCKVRGPELMELELSIPCTHIVDCCRNKIAFDNGPQGRHRSIETLFVDWTSQQASLVESLGFTIENENTKTYSWQTSLFVIYTNKRRIIISYEGHVKDQVTPIRKGCVTSVLFYANYFFLGTDRGKLMIYKVRCPEDCLTIDVYVTPCWEVQVCEGIVNQIAIAEPVHCKKTPFGFMRNSYRCFHDLHVSVRPLGIIDTVCLDD